MRSPKKVVYKSFKKYLRGELRKDAGLKILYQIEKAKLKFAHVLAETREQMGLTQKELADKMGVKQQLVSRIESGSENLTLETLIKILTLLHTALKIEVHKRKDRQDVVELIKT